MSTGALSRGGGGAGADKHVASEHTLDTTFAAVPPVGQANQLPTGVRSQRPAGHVHSGDSAFSPRQTGVRRKLHLPEPGESTSAPVQACVAALDATSDAVIILDRAGVVTYLNRACQVLLARERADQRTVGRHVLGLVCLDSTAVRDVLRALGKDSVWNGSLQVELGTRYRTLELCVSKFGRGPRTQSFSIVARPACPTAPSVSASTLVPQNSADVLATIARVASEIAHDFNNQIAVVLNYSFILLRELPSRSSVRGHVNELQSAAWRAAEVAREILRFGARRNLEPSEIDVHQLLRAAAAILCSMQAGGDNTSVELRLMDAGCRVLARRAQLEWLLFELSARLRARLGRLERLRMSTSLCASGEKTELDRPRVQIAIDAHPAQHSQLGTRDHVLAEEQAREAQIQSGQPQTLRAAERALEQAQGELTLHMLPDGGLRYLISLPALDRRTA